MTTYTGTLHAYITNSWTTLDSISNSELPVSDMMYSKHEMSASGWTKVGSAKVTVTMFPESIVLAGMVESIDAQIKRTHAEAESKINLLKEKKQSLLAITMESSSS